MKNIFITAILVASLFCFLVTAQNTSQLFKLKDIESRAATGENRLALKGEGGKSKNGLKGSPALKDFKQGTTEVLMESDGPGMIRHIWCTVSQNNPVNIRNIILRMYWEKSEIPSVEVPLSDFFGMAHGAPTLISSLLVSIQPSSGFNCEIPMPFKEHALITVTNESDTDFDWFFYQIDFTLGDQIGDDDGRFHASFNRENPTKYGRDFTIMETKGAKGVYLGCTVGVRPFQSGWWGEGEVKIYIDGDGRYPTICGTGIEDYFGAAWGIKAHSYSYRGAPLVETKYNSMYRFHINDPIYFKNDIRIDVQQMGLTMIDDAKSFYGDSLIYMRMDHPRRDTNRVFYLRADDVCAVAYWYQYPLQKIRKSLSDKALRSRDLYIRTKEEKQLAPM